MSLYLLAYSVSTGSRYQEHFVDVSVSSNLSSFLVGPSLTISDGSFLALTFFLGFRPYSQWSLMIQHFLLFSSRKLKLRENIIMTDKQKLPNISGCNRVMILTDVDLLPRLNWIFLRYLHITYSIRVIVEQEDIIVMTSSFSDKGRAPVLGRPAEISRSEISNFQTKFILVTPLAS